MEPTQLRRIEQALLQTQAEQFVNVLESSNDKLTNSQIQKFREMKNNINLILSTSKTSGGDGFGTNEHLCDIKCYYNCTKCSTNFEFVDDLFKNHQVSCTGILKQIKERYRNQHAQQSKLNVLLENSNLMKTTSMIDQSSIEMATNKNENKTIIRIEVDNFTNILSDSNALNNCVGRDDKEAFDEIRKQIYEILEKSRTVKVYVETCPNKVVEEKQYCNPLKTPIELTKSNLTGRNNITKKLILPKSTAEKKIEHQLKIKQRQNEIKWRYSCSETYANDKMLTVSNSAAPEIEVTNSLDWLLKENTKELPKTGGAALNKETRSLLTKDHSAFFNGFRKAADKLKNGQHIKTIENELTSFIKTIFPEELVKVYCFGSQIYGLANKNSILDVYIDIGHTLYDFEDFPSATTLDKLRKVHKALRKSSEEDDFMDLDALSKTRVPSFLVNHRLSGKDCKLHFSNILGMSNTILFEYLFKLQPIAYLLCLFLKTWMQRALLDMHINTYSLILMVVFYLQSLNVLPSIEKLQRNIDHENSVKVGPWIASYVPLELEDLNMLYVDAVYDNCLELVRGFFDFYIHYNYESNVICPYWGHSFAKEEFASVMPNRYVTHVASSLYNLELNGPVVLQDPIQLNHNVMEKLSLKHFDTFKKAMYESFKLMCKTKKKSL